MALSGVDVSDKVKQLVNEMKVRRSGADQNERVKFVKFRIGDGKIDVDNDSKLKVKDLEKEPDTYLKIVSLLTADECCYALYDCSYHTTETLKEDLVFIYWAANTAPVKQKMLYSSSRQGLNKACLQGIKIQIEMTDDGDKDKSNLVEKLEANGVTVTQLEGIPLSSYKK